MDTNKEKKTITSIFINKIIEEFNKNENNINNNFINPLLNKIYQNTYHYLFIIFLSSPNVKSGHKVSIKKISV